MSCCSLPFGILTYANCPVLLKKTHLKVIWAGSFSPTELLIAFPLKKYTGMTVENGPFTTRWTLKMLQYCCHVKILQLVNPLHKLNRFIHFFFCFKSREGMLRSALKMQKSFHEKHNGFSRRDACDFFTLVNYWGLKWGKWVMEH